MNLFGNSIGNGAGWPIFFALSGAIFQMERVDSIKSSLEIVDSPERCLLKDSFENTRQSVGVTTNPFSTKMEEKTKLNWKITWGKIRPKEDDDD